jgi:ADP-ribose pyrophosphatase YjhB (NUDIX family)
MSAPRVAVRAVLVVRGRVLLVNAYPGEQSDLWVPPGGGAEAGVGLHDNLVREVREETGLAIRPGRLLGLSEFHNPATGFHQVDLLFRARLAGPEEAVLADPAGVVNRLRWASEEELGSLRVKPGILPRVAFRPRQAPLHEALDLMVP